MKSEKSLMKERMLVLFQFLHNLGISDEKCGDSQLSGVESGQHKRNASGTGRSLRGEGTVTEEEVLKMCVMISCKKD